MVRFNIPQRLSSKLKLRLLNASEIIIMQACVSLLAACVSLLVDVHSLNGEDTFRTAINNPLGNGEHFLFYVYTRTCTFTL